jgi:hypothetical protein
MELLDKAFVSEKNRKQIFSNESQKKLEEYMRFRHFVRHSYGFRLEWDRMKDLTKGIKIFWETLKKDLNSFIECS